MKPTVRGANERPGEHRIGPSVDDRFGLARGVVSEPPPTIPEAGIVRIRHILAVSAIGRPRSGQASRAVAFRAL